MKKFNPQITPTYLPGALLLGLKVDNLFDLGQAVQTGLAIQAVETLGQSLGLTLSEILKLINLSESTYHHYRKQQRFLPSEFSVHLYQIARVLEQATMFFEDKTKAIIWLKTPRTIFRDFTPLQCTILPDGAAYVITVLNRLEHGVYL